MTTETPTAPPDLKRQINCLNKGFVRLVDWMGDDAAIVQAARVSYGQGTKTAREDEGLINYLVRNRHTSPIEMVEFKFHCKMPVFIARQWIRHRTANVNEVSGRYSEIKDEFFVPEPDTVKAQAKKNKQGRDGDLPDGFVNGFIGHTEDTARRQYDEYQSFLNPTTQNGENETKPADYPGVAREMARINLPLTMYTEWYWKIDLHNLLHFLGLRCDSHAQYEIRVFADAMLELITPIVPIAVAAWRENAFLAKTIPATIWKKIDAFLKKDTFLLDSVHSEAEDIRKDLRKIGIGV